MQVKLKHFNFSLEFGIRPARQLSIEHHARHLYGTDRTLQRILMRFSPCTLKVGRQPIGLTKLTWNVE